MKFSHPLARSAKVWPAVIGDREPQNILTIVTTLELDPDHKKHKPEHVERLRNAAQTFLSENADTAVGFLVMNKPKS